MAPIYLYALMESALRRKLGPRRASTSDAITELWSRLLRRSAATNEHAWLPTASSPPAELGAPTDDNRHGLLAVHQAALREPPGRPWPRADPDQRRRGRGGGGAAGPVGLPARRGGRVRRVVRLRARRPGRLAGDPRRSARPRCAHAGIGDRRRRARRPLLLLPGRRCRSRRPSSGCSSRSGAAADGHRRADLRRRAGQQLRRPRGGDARAAAAREDPDVLRAVHVARVVRHQARHRHLLGAAAGPRRTAHLRPVVDPAPAAPGALASYDGPAVVEAYTVAYDRAGGRRRRIVSRADTPGRAGAGCAPGRRSTSCRRRRPAWAGSVEVARRRADRHRPRRGTRCRRPPRRAGAGREAAARSRSSRSTGRSRRNADRPGHRPAARARRRRVRGRPDGPRRRAHRRRWHVLRRHGPQGRRPQGSSRSPTGRGPLGHRPRCRSASR